MEDLEKRVERLEKIHTYGFAFVGVALIGIYIFRASKK